MTNLPEWANWLARDKDGELWAYERFPYKKDYGVWSTNDEGEFCPVEETDDTFEHIKWTDERPTEIKRGLEAGGVSVEELNSITNTKAHGYDELLTMEKSKVYHGETTPENANENDILFEKGTIDGKQVTIMKLHNGTTFEPIGSAVTDKTERVYVDKDGVEITVGETTSISFEDAMALVENEVETDTTHTNNNKDMVNKPNHYIGEYGLEVEDVLRNFIPRYTDPYVGHRIASAIEYLLRSPLKNGQQDIEKARKNLDQALIYVEEKELRNIPMEWV